MRYLSCGYDIIAITDHSDYSNIETNVKAILSFVSHWPKNFKIKVSPGIELTHLPLEQFKPLAKYARRKGIKIIVAHGETLVEPVIKGTNQAALEADIDILAHPGLITEKEVKLATQKGIFLEVTSRLGHRDTNPHVVESALKFGAKLILNTDSHSPEDIITPQELKTIGLKAALSEQNINDIDKNVGEFLKDILRKGRGL
jgi:histidinol phosphatase-like PHP family hydrolase